MRRVQLDFVNTRRRITEANNRVIDGAAVDASVAKALFALTFP
jgi:hypothetical protein